MSCSARVAPLESILRTSELVRRPWRRPDHQAENEVFVALSQALAEQPREILQTLAEKMLEVSRCDSAGVSLLSSDQKEFTWPAIAGAWKRYIGGGTPRDFGPCGDVLDCGAALLFARPERRYPYLKPAEPAIEEALLVPFFLDGQAVGTIWAISHTAGRVSTLKT